MLAWQAESLRAARVAQSIDDILANYGNPTVRPGQLLGIQDVVDVNFGVDRMHNINQAEQLWGAVGFMRTWWCDSRLRFNETIVGPVATIMSSQLSGIVE